MCLAFWVILGTKQMLSMMENQMSDVVLPQLNSRVDSSRKPSQSWVKSRSRLNQLLTVTQHIPRLTQAGVSQCALDIAYYRSPRLRLDIFGIYIWTQILNICIEIFRSPIYAIPDIHTCARSCLRWSAVLVLIWNFNAQRYRIYPRLKVDLSRKSSRSRNSQPQLTPKIY